MTDIKSGGGIVTLCGSTKFYKQFVEANRLLTFYNWIVLAPGSFGGSIHAGESPPSGCTWDTVKRLHFVKIGLSDIIVVVTDKSQYIGDSTRAEIEYSKWLGKPIIWFIDDSFVGDEISMSSVFSENLEELTKSLEEFEKNHSLGY